MSTAIPLILCIEDEPAHALLIKHALKELDGEFSFAHISDGRAAIDYLFGVGESGDRTSYPVPALVLLDLNIPKVAGVEVLRRIKGDPEYAAIPVLIMSSSTSPQDVQIAYANHANCCLLKPQGFADLIDMLRGVTDFWLPRQRGTSRV